MAKTYYWLKFQKDFFKSLRIKRLRKLAGGDTFTIIYLKLQLLSLTTNGVLEYKGIFETFEEEMAEEIGEDTENIKVTIQYLLSCGLMERQDNSYFLPYVPMNTGSECDSAERVREHRARQKTLQCNNDVTMSNNNVITCNTEKEIEKDKEIDKEIERERINYQLIADMYNNTCVSFPKLQSLSDARKKAIKARLKNYSLEDIQRMFELAEASDFLKGKNDRNWCANFDWMIKDANMAKILDGNYNDKPTKQEKVIDNDYKDEFGLDFDEFFKMQEMQRNGQSC